ncbi:MAG TPA: hypothetical protein HA257_06360 [Candidatus Methanoperedenaceae archaeon]|nr:hypothetical protein [Candidatus Methanoperedenaceae archaeon]
MDIRKGLIAGLLAGITMVLVDSAVWAATQGYLMPLYETSAALWKPMDSGTWMTQMVALDIADGLIFGLVYSVIYTGIPQSGVRKGICYGFIVWLVGLVPGMAVSYLMMAIPGMIIVSWLLGGLVDLLAMGAVLAVAYEKIK